MLAYYFPNSSLSWSSTPTACLASSVFRAFLFFSSVAQNQVHQVRTWSFIFGRLNLEDGACSLHSWNSSRLSDVTTQLACQYMSENASLGFSSQNSVQHNRGLLKLRLTITSVLLHYYFHMVMGNAFWDTWLDDIYTTLRRIFDKMHPW